MHYTESNFKVKLLAGGAAGFEFPPRKASTGLVVFLVGREDKHNTTIKENPRNKVSNCQRPKSEI